MKKYISGKILKEAIFNGIYEGLFNILNNMMDMKYLNFMKDKYMKVNIKIE